MFSKYPLFLLLLTVPDLPLSFVSYLKAAFFYQAPVQHPPALELPSPNINYNHSILRLSVWSGRAEATESPAIKSTFG